MHLGQDEDRVLAKARMAELGWGFLQIGPDEWTWLKFDTNGNRIAQGGDETWAADWKSVGGY